MESTERQEGGKEGGEEGLEQGTQTPVFIRGENDVNGSEGGVLKDSG